MKALVFDRSPSKYAASKALGVLGARYRAGASSLRLNDSYELRSPGSGYAALEVRLSGICGSDLGLLTAKSSRYFEDLTSFPFVPGHEIVATTREMPGREGEEVRVVVEAVLGCRARGIDDLCAQCAAGHPEQCTSTVAGKLEPGVQIGYCSSTGGGWSESLYAHYSQLTPVPDQLSDSEALMTEPFACALHSVLGASLSGGENVLVLGAGTVGLLTLAALKAIAAPGSVTALARYSHQAALAASFGAQVVRSHDEARRAARSLSRTMQVGSRVSGGFDIVFDCVGSAESIEAALELANPGATVVLAGMPSPQRVDLSALWHKQLKLAGTYAYGHEVHQGHEWSTFDLALNTMGPLDLGRLVSVVYPLEDFEEAVNHALAAGRRSAVKIAFDPRAKTSRSSQKGS
ncbi:MAG: zinc-binding dehydrogenase [Actinomycetota bacterium]|nr:zinc-binding dehydrogenase [Actinomycetota bacterium]